MHAGESAAAWHQPERSANAYVPPPRRNLQPPIGPPPGFSTPFAKPQLQQQLAQQQHFSSPLQGPGMTLAESRPGTPFRDFYSQLLSDKAPSGGQVGCLAWRLALLCAVASKLHQGGCMSCMLHAP